jgi:hypothetical protein
MVKAENAHREGKQSSNDFLAHIFFALKLRKTAWADPIFLRSTAFHLPRLIKFIQKLTKPYFWLHGTAFDPTFVEILYFE